MQLLATTLSIIFHLSIRSLGIINQSNQYIRESQFRIGLWWKASPPMSVINANYKKTELCVLSYNSRGFGPLKQEYCRQLISSSVVGDKIPILCNQKNFMLRNNTYKINQALSNSYILIKPGVKESHSSGRPKGGLFIAVPGYFRNNIQDVSRHMGQLFYLSTLIFQLTLVEDE